MSSNRRASFPVNALRRSPRRRTKTPSVNELSKKCKLSPKGKRRLEFQHVKPLKGRTYYLDLQGYRKTSSLETRIKELGGKVEEFLSKDISCVVTNRKDADTRCSPRSNSTPSPILSIPSPFPGNNTKSSSAKGSAVPSPLSADSGGAEQTGPAATKHNIRGKALAAQAAVTCKYGTSNIIANARNWGLQIVQLEKMLEKLEQYGSIEKKPVSKPLVSGRVAKQSVKPKVRKLYAPFIKVEDHSRCYKPLVHELKEWPKIYFDGPWGSCPFDSPKKDTVKDHDQHDRTKRKPVQEEKNKKKGFCECCCVHYDDLDLHLNSDRHQSFARDSSNYRSLDELINKGPSLQDFLAKMLLKHEQKEKENQEKNRIQSSSPEKSSVARAERQTPPKQTRDETSANCQTPIDHAPSNNAECHTPTMPSPETKDACHTPTTHCTPQKNSADDDTPTRVLRSRDRKNDVKGVDTRELGSSPRTPNALKGKNSSVKKNGTCKRQKIKEIELNSKKLSDGISQKQTTHAKTRSTTSSPVAACSIRGKDAPRPQESPKRTRSVEGKKYSPTSEKKEDVKVSSEGVRTRTSQQDSSDECSSKENYDPETVVDSRESEATGSEDRMEQLKLRSGTARGGKPARGTETEDRVGSQTKGQEEFHVDKGSPKTASLRSATKESTARELKKSESPKQEEATGATQGILERNTHSRMQSSPTTEQSSDDSAGVSEKKTSESSLSDERITAESDSAEHSVPMTRSRAQSAPAFMPSCDPNVGGTVVSDVSLPVTQESTGEQVQPFHAEKRRPSSRLQAVERTRETLCSQENSREVTDESQITSQSSKSFTRGDAVADVKIQLSDCRRMCVDRKRPILEREPDESDTESIQLSSDKNVSPSKELPANKMSEEEVEEVSSTPTLNHCPSSPSSEKSGYSEERAGYSLRRRAEQQQEEGPNIIRRTRSNYKIPDEKTKKGSRRKTVTSPFTNVKSRSPKQRCQPVKSFKNNTPERKNCKNSKEMESPLKTTPCGKVPKLKDPASESDSNTLSGSPRSGPVRETRSTRASTRSAVRNLKEADLDNVSTPFEDVEDAKEASALSDTTVSLGDVSTTAICGTPRHLNPADCIVTSDFRKRGITSLSGTDLSEEQKFPSAGFLSKGRETNDGVDPLFDSDNEDEDFYGFNVPQFDGSFSSEGDLSFKINSIVESMNHGDTSQDTIDDVENITLQEDHADVIRENVQEKSKTDTETNKEISKNCDETKKAEATRKRKSESPIASAAAEFKRTKSDSKNEGGNLSDSYKNFFSVIDDRDIEGGNYDVDEDDDVFSTVSGSTDGEEGEEEVGSPFSIISWSQKRKSEHLAEVDRPTKRLRSVEQGSEQMVTSSLSSTSETFLKSGTDPEIQTLQENREESTPLKSGAARGIGEHRENREESTSFTSRLNEILNEKMRNRVHSFSSVEDSCEFYDSDEPVYQTLEERVKLRRLRNLSRKARENSSSSAQNQDNNTQKSHVKPTASAATKQEVPRNVVLPLKPLKHVSPVPASSKKAALPLKPLEHVSPFPASSRKAVLPLKPLKHASPISASSRKGKLPLKLLKHISPIRTSSRLHRANSSPSSSQSPLATPSGKPRRPTWIYDVSEFASPPSEVRSVGRKRVACSTPVSANPSKHSLRPRRSSEMESRNSRQTDAYVFDE